MLLSHGEVDGLIQFITVIIIFFLVFAITIWATRWMAGYQKAQMNAKNMAIIETMRLSQSQYVQIIRIGTKYMAIAVSKDNVTKLADLDEEDVEVDEAGQTNYDFSTIFEKVKNSIPAKDKTDETLHEEEKENHN